MLLSKNSKLNEIVCFLKLEITHKILETASHVELEEIYLQDIILIDIRDEKPVFAQLLKHKYYELNTHIFLIMWNLLLENYFESALIMLHFVTKLLWKYYILLL